MYISTSRDLPGWRRAVQTLNRGHHFWARLALVLILAFGEASALATQGAQSAEPKPSKAALCRAYLTLFVNRIRGASLLSVEANSRIDAAFEQARALQSSTKLNEAFTVLEHEYHQQAQVAGANQKALNLEKARAIDKWQAQATLNARAARGLLSDDSYAKVEAAFAKAYSSKKKANLDAAYALLESEYRAAVATDPDRRAALDIDRTKASILKGQQYAAMIAADPTAAVLTPNQEIEQLRNGPQVLAAAWRQDELIVLRDGVEIARGRVDDFRVEGIGYELRMTLNGRDQTIRDTDEIRSIPAPVVNLSPLTRDSRALHDFIALRDEYLNAIEQGAKRENIELTMNATLAENLAWMQQHIPETFANLGEDRPQAEDLIRKMQAMERKEKFSYVEYFNLCFEFSVIMRFRPEVFDIYTSKLNRFDRLRHLRVTNYVKAHEDLARGGMFAIPMAQSLDVRTMNRLVGESIAPYGLTTTMMHADGRTMDPLEFFEHDRAHANYFGNVSAPGPRLSLAQKSQFYSSFEDWVDKSSTSDKEKNVKEDFWFELFHESGGIVHPQLMYRLARYQILHLSESRLYSTSAEKAIYESIRDFAREWAASQGIVISDT